MKLHQGDAFEQHHSDWITNRLPHYEAVWAAFIGHNGRGWPCEMPGLDERAESDRKRFYQAHYSFACKMHAIDVFVQEGERTLGQAVDWPSFEAEMNRLFCLMASVGYVRDMFKNIDEALKCGGALWEPLNTFYTQRNYIVHGVRVPTRIDDSGLLMIPKLGGENKLDDEWDDKSAWDEIPANTFIHLQDYSKDLVQELFSEVNTVHGKVFDAANRRFEGMRITPPAPDSILSSLGDERSPWTSSSPPSGECGG